MLFTNDFRKCPRANIYFRMTCRQAELAEVPECGNGMTNRRREIT